MPPAPTFEIDGEPCANPDWDPARESIFDFVWRMRQDRGWILGNYDLPHPTDGRWPRLRVDQDSAVWTVWIRYCVYMCIGHEAKDPHVRVAFAAPAAGHLELMDHLEADGYLAGHEAEGIRQRLRNFVSPNSRKALDREGDPP